MPTFCCFDAKFTALHSNLYLTLTRCRLTFDEVGVVAALSQLHHGVDQVGHVCLAGSFRQEREVLLQDGAVVFLLNVGELHLDDGFLFGSQLLLHVLLQPPQHHGLQYTLELLYLWAKKTRRELQSYAR